AEGSIELALERTISYLEEQRKRIWLVLQVPEVDFSIDECLGRPFTFEAKPPPPCGVAESAVLAAQARYRRIVGDIKRRHQTIKIFDPLQSLGEDGWCSVVRGGHALYADRQHLTEAGSLFFADKFDFN